LKRSVEQQVLINRPVVFSNGISIAVAQDGVPNRVRIVFSNFGKSVALNVVPVGHIEIGSDLFNAPYDDRCNPRYRPPRFVVQSALAPTEDGGALMFADFGAPPHWDLNEFKKDPTKKVVWIVGCVYYESLDHQRHYSDVCNFWAPSRVQSEYSDFPACLDSRRNFVE
jgi:hypothetical protein